MKEQKEEFISPLSEYHSIVRKNEEETINLIKYAQLVYSLQEAIQIVERIREELQEDLDKINLRFSEHE